MSPSLVPLVLELVSVEVERNGKLTKAWEKLVTRPTSKRRPVINKIEVKLNNDEVRGVNNNIK